jgi:tetratricopeptide (TPR) repeat protein
VAALCAVLAASAGAQTTQKVRLDTNESVFATFAALNACGYDADLANSDPLRAQIRSEIAANVSRSPEAQVAQQRVCTFYSDHHQPDSGRDIAQYVSLALYLTDAPKFNLATREADLPPDAAYVLGFLPVMRQYYQAAGLREVWRKHQRDYEARLDRASQPISKMIFDTDNYLRVQSGGYVGRTFTAYIEPMAAPSHVNSRNYGTEYYLVISPDTKGELPMAQIRHTYLHYVLDPMALKRRATMQRLEPLLDTVQRAPIDESFKYDVSLLVTESLIQAIEAHTLPGGKAAEPQRIQAMRDAMEQGYVLTHYFYEALENFEKQPAGIADAYGDMLHDINVDTEKRRARDIAFKDHAHGEIVAGRSLKRYERILDIAEQRLSTGDVAGAQKYAQQALDEHSDDPARALFILGRCALRTGDADIARKDLSQSIEIGHDPRMLAWSHIYLGRIFDLQQDREQALTHYRAALAAGDPASDTKNAAESGLAQPYQPPTPHQ